ncbi:MAG TPA: extradiol ring-cleavage dioxygenase [Candidatus Dormibacteraeota bacterium]|jgi:aromatic ring-opening dioxygenase LigB subunit|nr:extradiol ring-cleavage dioxygenase [Candidatus Dormibacteraeota bacterium]
MAIVSAVIAPHGSQVIEGAAAADATAAARVTTAGMEELGRHVAASGADTAIVFTPHNVHVEGAMAVIESGRIEGALEGGTKKVALDVPVERELAADVKQAVRSAGVPVVGLSYGGNDAASAAFPMDWAVFVPLWFLGGRQLPPIPTVVMCPARDLDAETHVRAGRAVADAARRSGRRIVIVASCDQGHRHLESGPYGYAPDAAAFDDQMADIVRSGDLRRLLDIDPAFVSRAAADSWWQSLLLHGALGDGWRSELISYEHPTYFGMLCAAFSPATDSA